MKSISTWEEAKLLADACRMKGGVVVSTNGCFDILHKGHVSYLAYARQLGDLLLVGINSDASVKQNKGPLRPLNDEEARAQVLSAIKYVDAVCIFKEDTPVQWLKTIRPSLHVKGGDWDVSKIPETAVLAQWGGRVVSAPFMEGFSTTKLIEKAQSSK